MPSDLPDPTERNYLPGRSGVIRPGAATSQAQQRSAQGNSQGCVECINIAFGPNASVFRIGGDEFTIISRKPAELIAENVALLRELTQRWTGGKQYHLALAIDVKSLSQCPSDTSGTQFLRLMECLTTVFRFSGTVLRTLFFRLETRSTVSTRTRAPGAGRLPTPPVPRRQSRTFR